MELLCNYHVIQLQYMCGDIFLTISVHYRGVYHELLYDLYVLLSL